MKKKLDKKSLLHLKKIIKFNKLRALKMCLEFGGHISSSFSTAEIITYLYSMNIINKKKTNRFILSKGHGQVYYYSLLAMLKYFPERWLFSNYRTKICDLGGHTSHKVNGIEFSAGSLGHGLSYASGLSYAHKLKKKNAKTFCLLGDAELNEGSIWEAAIFSAKQKLNNLIALVDNNKIGSSDFTKNYISEKCLAKSWRSLGWEVYDCNGHSFQDINKYIFKILNSKIKKPKVLILDTIKGSGVSFIENDPIWHVKGIDKKMYEEALKEIEKKY